jgi:hypothetical protein
MNLCFFDRLFYAYLHFNLILAACHFSLALMSMLYLLKIWWKRAERRGILLACERVPVQFHWEDFHTANQYRDIRRGVNRITRSEKPSQCEPKFVLKPVCFKLSK